MEFHRQSPCACLAYSLYNIGVISRSALAEYEIMMIFAPPAYSVIGGWLNAYAKPLGDFFGRYGGNIPKLPGLRAVPKNGKGVALWDLGPDHCRHAMSWEDGMLLDPGEDAPGYPESLKDIKARLKKKGMKPRLLACVEV